MARVDPIASYRFVRYPNVEMMEAGMVAEAASGWRLVSIALDWDDHWMVALERLDATENATPSFFGDSVMTHDWTTRVGNALAAAGIRTWGDLASKAPHELLKMKNFGRGSLAEVNRALAEKGLAWGLTSRRGR